MHSSLSELQNRECTSPRHHAHTPGLYFTKPGVKSPLPSTDSLWNGDKVCYCTGDCPPLSLCYIVTRFNKLCRLLPQLFITLLIILPTTTVYVALLFYRCLIRKKT